MDKGLLDNHSEIAQKLSKIAQEPLKISLGVPQELLNPILHGLWEIHYHTEGGYNQHALIFSL